MCFASFALTNMKILALTILFVTTLASLVSAQGNSLPKTDRVSASPAVSTELSPLEVAKATLAAHGGEKLKNMKTLVMKGALEMNVFNQTTPATFSIAISGEKYSFEINNPFQPLKQVSDGTQTYSSLQGFSLPPITSVGFPLLPKIGDAGYVIAGLLDAKKKKRGFRITAPDGFFTDFFVDEKTNQIKGYESSYEVGERTVTTSVEVDEFQTVDGIILPKKYSQRFDLGSLTAYASFRTKDILVNVPIDDSAFAIPR